MQREVHGEDLVVPQHTTDHHCLGLDVHKLVAVPLADGKWRSYGFLGGGLGTVTFTGSLVSHDVADGDRPPALKLRGASGAKPTLALEREADARWSGDSCK